MGSTTNKIMAEKTRKAHRIDIKVQNRSRNNDCSTVTNMDYRPTERPIASLQYHRFYVENIITVPVRMDRRVKAVRKKEELPLELQEVMEKCLASLYK